jgi:hypothetical protein
MKASRSGALCKRPHVALIAGALVTSRRSLNHFSRDEVRAA